MSALPRLEVLLDRFTDGTLTAVARLYTENGELLITESRSTSQVAQAIMEKHGTGALKNFLIRTATMRALGALK